MTSEPRTTPPRRSREDPAWVRFTLIFFAFAVLGVLIVVPVVNVFVGALSEGLAVYWHSLVGDPDTRHAITLTLTVVPIALAANVVFGVSAAWAISRFRFPGRTLLIALIDLPFAVSPVVAGLMFVLIFGLQGYFGKFLRSDGYAIMPYVVAFVLVLIGLFAYFTMRPTNPRARTGVWRHPPWIAFLAAAGLFAVLVVAQQALHVWPHGKNLKIIFATPGLVLATAFVTFPFVARELIPFMEAQGTDEEEAALVLGASGWQIFSRITLPNVKWSLLYGVILANARAMGEFGAVSVVSGHVRGLTNTLPLHVEILYNEYAFRAAFAVASLLFLLALLTLLSKKALEWTQRGARHGPARRSAP